MGARGVLLEALKTTGDQLNPFSPSGATGAELATKAAGAAAVVRPWLYAATATNTHGGTGLICPWCSSTFRGMVGEYSGYATKFNEAAPLIGLVYAEGNALAQEYQLAKQGQCAASF